MSDLIRLGSLLPDYYEGIYDMDVIMRVEQPLLNELEKLIETNRDNHFAMLADAQGLSIFENMLGITGVAGLDLDTRRYKVIMELLPPNPITIGNLRQVLEALNINAELIVDAPKFHVEVKIKTPDSSAIKRLKILLNRYLPANLTFTTFNFNQVSTSGAVQVGTDHLISASISNKGGE